MRVFAAVFMFAFPCAGALAQVPWEIQVKNLATGQGIPGVIVEGRSSRVRATTDAAGIAQISVRGGRESVTVHGGAGFNYNVGDYPVDGPRVVYLVPDAMFHQTPLIPVAGTASPIVFQGTTECVFGANPYTIEVEIPANVLPEPASFWIAPVPAHASPWPMDADRIVASTIGQFAIKLVNASGKEINDVLPEPGIVVRSTPTWYPYSAIVQTTDVVPGAQYRLTKTSGRWSGQPDRVTWDPGSGMYTAHLRACSWWVIAFVVLIPSSLGTADVPPPPELPAAPKIEITKSDCVSSGASDSTPVRCGVTVLPVSLGLTNGGSTTFSAQFTASLMASLGVAPSDLASVLTRITAQLSGTLSVDGQGQVTHTATAIAGAPIPAGTVLGSPCYSGNFSTAVAERTFTLTYGTHSVQWKFPERIMKVACLGYDPDCHTEEHPCPMNMPHSASWVSPPGLTICAGDPLKCP